MERQNGPAGPRPTHTPHPHPHHPRKTRRESLRWAYCKIWASYLDLLAASQRLPTVERVHLPSTLAKVLAPFTDSSVPPSEIELNMRDGPRRSVLRRLSADRLRAALGETIADAEIMVVEPALHRSTLRF